MPAATDSGDVHVSAYAFDDAAETERFPPIAEADTKDTDQLSELSEPAPSTASVVPHTGSASRPGTPTNASEDRV